MLEQVFEDINRSLRNGDKKTAEALKLLYNSLKNAKIDNRGELSEERATTIIKKEIKKRVEARDMYSQNDRAELASQEEFERALYSQYVPAELTADKIDEVISFVADGLEEVKFATLMPAVMKEVAGQADGRLVSDRVKHFIDSAQ